MVPIISRIMGIAATRAQDLEFESRYLIDIAWVTVWPCRQNRPIAPRRNVWCSRKLSRLML